MNRPEFYTRIAFNHLLHGGQRTFVALLCVAFGVMSLVSMMLLSSALERMLVDTPQDLIGADISMDRAADAAILPQQVDALEALRGEGVLDAYTLVAYTSSLTFHLPGSGELHFPGAGIGIDPAAYPPVGSLTVENAGGVGLPTLLAGVGDVLISRDLALEHHLSVGDTLVLSDLAAGAPQRVRIRGIIIDTPNHKGSKLYYTLETAALLDGTGHALNTVLATAPDPAAARQRLEPLGWQVYLADELAADEEQVQDFFASLLNGAGVLGLLVSGVGIANTMQVLLRRRQREVAVWKSIGYRSGDLLLIFSLEAGLLGLAGSLLGAGLGIAISAGLVNLFSRTSTLLVRWVLTPAPVLLAILVGVATTVIFAMWAIVVGSRVRPATLLRGETASAAQLSWWQSLVLLVALAVPFTAVITLIMGSPLKAVGVLAAALAGLVGLGGGLWTLLWLVTLLLPLSGIPLLHIARGSLQRRGLIPVFALVALFVGVVALTMASVVTQNAGRVMESAQVEMQDYNLTIVAPAGQREIVAGALKVQAMESWSEGYTTGVRSIRLSGHPDERFTPLLVARSQPAEYTVSGAPWGSRPDGVYTTAFAGIPEGSVLEVTLWDGSVRKLPVVGSFQVDFRQLFRPEMGVLLPVELSQAVAPPDQVLFFVRAPAGRLAALASELGTALPEATVINRVAYAARFTSQYHNLFVFAVSMASLALLAGVLLMANAVSLSVLDRRYEIGVLKAMGYARGHILFTLMLEYALIALVAAGTGLALVRVFLWLVGMQSELAASLMVLSPLSAGVVLAATVGLALAAVLAAAWRSTQVSPLVVLNDRE